MLYIHGVNLRNVDLNLLLILNTLLLERSVTRASKRLCMTQPAVSNALKRLRATFNDPLLVRGNSRVTELTARASALIKPVHDVLTTIEHAIAGDTPFDPHQIDLTVRVAATEYVGFMVLPPLMTEIRKTAPRIRLAVSDIEKRDRLGPLRSGMVDLVIAFVPDSVGELHQQLLLRDTWVYVVNPAHFHSKQLTRKQFKSSDHIALRSQPGGSGFYGFYVDHLFAEQELERNIVVSMPHVLAIPDIVSRTDLVKLVPRKVALVWAKQYPLRLVKPPVHIPDFAISMLWHERTEADPAQQWIRRTLARLAESL